LSSEPPALALASAVEEEKVPFSDFRRRLDDDAGLLSLLPLGLTIPSVLPRVVGAGERGSPLGGLPTNFRGEEAKSVLGTANFDKLL